MNACGDSRLRGLRSRKPIGFRQWVVHSAKHEKSHITHNTKENGGINDKRGKHTQNRGKI